MTLLNFLGSIDVTDGIIWK